MRYQGAGSSMINPTRVTTVKDAFQQRGLIFPAQALPGLQHILLQTKVVPR